MKYNWPPLCAVAELLIICHVWGPPTPSLGFYDVRCVLRVQATLCTVASPWFKLLFYWPQSTYKRDLTHFTVSPPPHSISIIRIDWCPWGNLCGMVKGRLGTDFIVRALDLKPKFEFFSCSYIVQYWSPVSHYDSLPCSSLQVNSCGSPVNGWDWGWLLNLVLTVYFPVWAKSRTYS